MITEVKLGYCCPLAFKTVINLPDIVVVGIFPVSLQPLIVSIPVLELSTTLFTS
jgi:hypothetical protein